MAEPTTYCYGAYADANQGCAHEYLLPALLKMLGPPSGAILDLGCGNGWIAKALAERGHNVYGIDASPTGIGIANSRMPGHFFVMDVIHQRLPDPLASVPFTTVISTEVIEHLYDPRAFLRLARSVVGSVPGRRLVLSTPYHGYLKNLALAATGKLDAHHTVLWDGGHIKFFSRPTIEQMLRDEGFKPCGFTGAGRLPFLWKSMLVAAEVA